MNDPDVTDKPVATNTSASGSGSDDDKKNMAAIAVALYILAFVLLCWVDGRLAFAWLAWRTASDVRRLYEKPRHPNEKGQR